MCHVSSLWWCCGCVSRRPFRGPSVAHICLLQAMRVAAYLHNLPPLPLYQLRHASASCSTVLIFPRPLPGWLFRPCRAHSLPPSSVTPVRLLCSLVYSLSMPPGLLWPPCASPLLGRSRLTSAFLHTPLSPPRPLLPLHTRASPGSSPYPSLHPPSPVRHAAHTLPSLCVCVCVPSYALARSCLVYSPSLLHSPSPLLVRLPSLLPSFPPSPPHLPRPLPPFFPTFGATIVAPCRIGVRSPTPSSLAAPPPIGR